MRIEQMTGRTGQAVANQFIIREAGREVFQSYSSIIAVRSTISGKILLDRDKWDYSVTTGKYRNQFLNETKKETEKKIKSGEYTLINLN